MERKLLTDREAAAYTGLSIWAVNELRRRGELISIRPGSIRRYYFTVESLDKFLESQVQGQEAGKLRVVR